MWQFLTSILSGGAMGVIMRVFNGVFEEVKAGREHARKLEEMKVMASIKQDEAAWNAFTASQNAAVAPANVHSWVSDILALFRPFITLILLILTTVIWFYAAEPAKLGMVDQVAFAAFNAVGWWFGDRMAYRSKLK